MSVTDQGTESTDRLERIERLVEVISQKVEANSEAIANLGHRVDANTQAIAALTQKMDMLSQEMKDEVRRWDERFFKFAEDTANRANTLIASATIAVIAGVLLLILKQ